MENIKLLCWNMEWMNDLFDGDGNFRPDDHNPQHAKKTTVKKRREDLSGVLNELQPEIVQVVEGPNRTKELQLFFDTDVEGTWRTYIQHTKGTSQAVGLAVRTDTGKFDAENPVTFFDTVNEEAFKPFELDNEDDGIIELYKFERNPVYAEVRTTAGDRFRILGIHLKSKGIFDLLEWSKFWERSVSNRRKILATATHIRTAFLEPYLEAPETKNVPLIICGDVNDGPGLDASEKKIFGSAIERLMGNVWHPDLTLGNALYDTYKTLEISTTQFVDPIFNFNFKYHRVWIDHILYSHRSKSWLEKGEIIKDVAAGKIWTVYKHASDHQPIMAEIKVEAL